MATAIRKYLQSLREGWQLSQTGYSPQDEGGWETLLTLCNGNVGVRGSLELPSAQRQTAAYFAGVFDKPDRAEEGRAFGVKLKTKAITPALAIMPTWRNIEVEVDGRSVDFLNCEILNFERTLDLARGIVISAYALQDGAGRITEIRTLAMVSKADLHYSVQQVEVEATNYSGQMTVRFINEQDTSPDYIPRLRDYISKTNLEGMSAEGDAVLLDARVSETDVQVSLATKTVAEQPCRNERGQYAIKEVFDIDVTPGQCVAFTRHACFYTSLDVDDPREAALEHLQQITSQPAEEHLQRHFAYWAKQWALADVAIQGDDDVQLGLRWDIFNLIQMGNAENLQVSISATGLHGQGYFGHVFWDTEIYLLPFYLATDLDVARNLLLYRYHRLDAAKQNAIDWGFKGARYPWTSTWQGYDVTPPDWESKREVHITGAVALGFQRYLAWTGDEEFYKQYGIEVLVETAKFWLSRVALGDDGRYHLNDIVGPDEYNTVADDNYYTNHLACWNMRQAVESMAWLSAEDPAQYEILAQRTAWSEELKDAMVDVLTRMFFPRVRDGVCEQHRGFFDLADAVITKRGRYNMPIVESYSYEGGSQRSKQADVVMMHYLFEDDFDAATKRASYEYYDQRCTQGSSLSPAIYSIMGLILGLSEHAYGYFQLTALLDLKNMHLDKNLHEGIHAACAGGTWKAAVYGYGGVSIRAGRFVINPQLPPQWESLQFGFLFQGRTVRVSVTKDSVTVALEGEPLEATVLDNPVKLAPSMANVFPVAAGIC